LTDKTSRPSSGRNSFAEWVNRNSITNFILFSFGFSYLIGGAFYFWVTQFSADLPHVLSLYAVRMLIVIGPAVGAISVSYLIGGGRGVRCLLQKLIPRKRHVGWWLILPLLGTSITFISFLIGGLSLDSLSAILADGWGLFILHLLIQILLIGIGEELGWRGWLLPKLAQRFPLGVSMLLIFIVWTLWHFPILLMGADIVVPWIFVAISATIILTWIWIKVKGNVFVLAIAHASINGSQFFIENQIGQEQNLLLLESWRITGYIYLAVGILFLFLLRYSLAKKVDPID